MSGDDDFGWRPPRRGDIRDTFGKRSPVVGRPQPAGELHPTKRQRGEGFPVRTERDADRRVVAELNEKQRRPLQQGTFGLRYPAICATCGRLMEPGTDVYGHTIGGRWQFRHRGCLKTASW